MVGNPEFNWSSLPKLSVSLLLALLLGACQGPGAPDSTGAPETRPTEGLPPRPEPGVEVLALEAALPNHFYFPSRSPLVTEIFTPLPPGSAQPTGPLRDSLTTRLEELLSPEPVILDDPDDPRLPLLVNLAATLDRIDLLERLADRLAELPAGPFPLERLERRLTVLRIVHLSTARPALLLPLRSTFELARQVFLAAGDSRQVPPSLRVEVREVARHLYNQEGHEGALELLRSLASASDPLSGEAPLSLRLAREAGDPFNELEATARTELRRAWLAEMPPGPEMMQGLPRSTFEALERLVERDRDSTWALWLADSIPAGGTIRADNIDARLCRVLGRQWMATPGDGLALMGYGHGQVQALVGEDAGVVIRCEVSSTGQSPATFEVSVEPRSRVRFPLTLPAPAASGGIRVSVNRRSPVLGKPGEYLTLLRTWGTTDLVRVEILAPPTGGEPSQDRDAAVR